MNNNRKVDYNRFAEMNIAEIMQEFKTTMQGFSEETAAEIRKEFGNNEIEYGEKTPLWLTVLKAYFTPFTLILLALAAISFVTEFILADAGDKSLVTVLLIVVLVVISGTMSLIQSVKANDAAEELQQMVKVTTAVKRDGQYQEIPLQDIVMGDLIKLSAGDMIPADLRIIQSKDLFVSQASLTGESYPVEKKAELGTTRNFH